MEMTSNHFKIAIEATKYKDRSKVRSAYLVIFCGWKQKAARERYQLGQSIFSRALNSIRRRWQNICAENGLRCEMVALTPEQMETVRQLEYTNIGKLLEKGKKMAAIRFTRFKSALWEHWGK